MSPLEPNNETLERWLAGDLTADQSAELDRYADEHPEFLEASELNHFPAEILDGLNSVKDEALQALVERVKTRSGIPHVSLQQTPWQEILTPSDNEALLGMLGPYEVNELIAIGGMGIVLKAREPKLDRTVAIKVLSPLLATNATACRRFLREARAAANLEHENILPIFAIHDEGSFPYFTMRYVGGGTLEDKLKTGEPLEFDEIKSIALQAASALGAAHAKGLVHRDIKPGNILFDDDGSHLWVCDFGIARSTEDPSLTYGGTVAGTPHYMSPEQAEGRSVDGRSDLFSLGAVMYRCSTGALPFDGENSTVVLKKVADFRPPIADKLNRNIPRWFAQLLEKLLTKSPDGRFADAESLIHAIDHPVEKRRKILLPALAAGIAIIAVAFVYTNKGTAPQAEITTFEIESSGELFQSLKEAIAGARDGDTISLHGETPINVDALVIPLGKALTFTALPGASGRPVLTTTSGSAGIISHSPLKMTGIDFQLKAEENSDGIVKLINVGARFDDCRFEGKRFVPPLIDRGRLHSRVVELHGSGTIDFNACKIDVEQSEAVALRDLPRDSGEVSLLFRDCVITGRYAVSILGFETERDVAIDVINTEFIGHIFLMGFNTHIPKLNVQAQRSSFSLGRSLLWFRMGDPTIARQNVRWEGKDNSYPLGKAHLLVSASALHGQDFMEVDITMESPQSTEGFVEIEGSGRRFKDLGKACDAASDGDTLLLSGTLVCNETIKTPPGRTLHLRASSEASPRLMITDYTAIGLQLSGPATVHGIEFARLRASQMEGVHPLVFANHAGPFHFEDCLFESSPEVWDRSSGAGIGTLDVKSITVSKCLFRMPGGDGIMIDHIHSHNGPKTELVIEHSLITAKNAFKRRVAGIVKASKRTKIVSEDCVFVVDCLLDQNDAAAVLPIELVFGSNVIDVEESYFALLKNKELARSMPNQVTWRGDGNFYRQMKPVFPWTAVSVSDFLENPPISSDPRGVLTSLVDRRFLRHPVTPQALRKLLPKNIGEEILKAFE